MLHSRVVANLPRRELRKRQRTLCSRVHQRIVALGISAQDRVVAVHLRWLQLRNRQQVHVPWYVHQGARPSVHLFRVQIVSARSADLAIDAPSPLSDLHKNTAVRLRVRFARHVCVHGARRWIRCYLLAMRHAVQVFRAIQMVVGRNVGFRFRFRFHGRFLCRTGRFRRDYGFYLRDGRRHGRLLINEMSAMINTRAEMGMSVAGTGLVLTGAGRAADTTAASTV
ncbi:hypothetical protein DFH07DRAFT_86653 [Mycena maculata]|uniref:Uncharacterized protein n=1 Tax=Mycena maculata TaxID=230809 RepID=A0AAD7I9L4_9AGAR|nr:hypothetical protein DFH07DRAFT_86653 [Mycena maculata]